MRGAGAGAAANTDRAPSYSLMDESMLDLSSTSTAESISTTVQTRDTELAKELRRFSDEMQQMREAFVLLRKEVEEMRTSVTACGGRLDELEARVGALEQRGEDERVAMVISRVEALEQQGENEEVSKAVAALESTVAQLKLELQDREQDLLLNDADISNVPETRGENVMHLVLSCAAKVGVKLEERDVVSCSRVGPVRAVASDAVSPRPRAIAVKLARRALRDALLKAARVRRTPDTQGIGLSGDPHRFYINERLTRENRRLFYMARETAKDQKWKYVWTRDGRIYVRKGQDEARHQIRCEADLEKTFGKSFIRPT